MEVKVGLQLQEPVTYVLELFLLIQELFDSR